MPGKKIIIFGVSGQDGSYLAKLLLSKGFKVYGTSRDAEVQKFSNLKTLGIKERISVVSVAINDFGSVFQCIKNISPDVIYNLASQSSVALSFSQPHETMESIELGTLNILESIRLYGKEIKFYNACSSECFGDTGETKADEKTPFNPLSPYAVSKAAAFWTVKNYREAYGISACSGILFNHESPLRQDRFVTKKIINAENKIAYIDINYILNNSLAGQSISKHIQEIKEKKNIEFTSIEKRLKDEETKIIKQKNIIKKNEFEEQVNKLREEVNEYNKNKEIFKEEIKAKKIKYTKIILNKLNPIISNYVEENSITIVFPKKNIIIAKKDLDITKLIMDLLNNQLNKIDF